MAGRARSGPPRAARTAAAVLLGASLLAGTGAPLAGPAAAEVTGGYEPTPVMPPPAPVQDLYVTSGAGTGYATALCRSGDYVINGGWRSARGEAVLLESTPTEEADGWFVDVADGAPAEAWAVCVDLRDGLSVYTRTVLTGGDTMVQDDDDRWVPERGVGEATASCAPGDLVIGGGWGAGTHEHLHGSFPKPQDASGEPARPVGWAVVAGVTGHARALCTAPGVLYDDVRVATGVDRATSAPFEEDEPSRYLPTRARVQCPRGTALVSGGHRGGHHQVIRNHPVAPAGWFSEQSEAEMDGMAFALCATLGNGLRGLVVTAPTSVPHGGGLAVAACPAGLTAIGGGYALDPHPRSAGTGAWQLGPRTGGDAWVLHANHTGEVHAICARAGRTSAMTSRVETAPAYAEEPVAIVARVHGSGPTPRGTVTFGSGLGPLGTATVDPSSEAWLTTTALPVGRHEVWMDYGGDATYGSSSSIVSVEVHPARRSTTTTLRSSEAPAPRATPVTLTSAVTPEGTGSTPTGTVAFFAGGDEIGRSAIASDGTATISHSFSESGTHVLEAVYGGDDAHRGSRGRLVLTVGIIITVPDLVLVEADAAPSTTVLEVRLSEPVQQELRIPLQPEPEAGPLFPGGTAPTWEVVVRAGERSAALPVTVAPQLESGTHEFQVEVGQLPDGVHAARSAVRGVLRVTHPTCTAADTAGTGRLIGTSGPDVLCGLGGDDELVGAAGDDVLLGGDGDDRLVGGAGDDELVGGRGSDRLTGAGGDDVLRALDGTHGNDVLSGGGGANRCESDALDRVLDC